MDKPALPASLHAWMTEAFAQILKDELQRLAPGTLPLEKGVAQGGYVDDSEITITVQGASDDDAAVHARIGVFFTEIVVNCGCGDDPMPIPAYCEMRVTIDKASGEARFALIQD